MRYWGYISILLFCWGCSIYEVPETFTIIVKSKYPETINNGTYIPEANVILCNVQTGREYSGKSNENGIAKFEVRAGIYDIVVSLYEKREITINGYPTLKNLQFQGAIRGYQLLKDEMDLEMETKFSIVGEGFVIKELYASGSRTPEGKIYNADKFVEIYNNSNQVLYSDGLCFGIVRHRRTYTPNPWVDANREMLPRIPVWSFVAIVAGTGEEHPIEPGESFVIALSGINHRDDPNGNPNSIDLSKAQWEMVVEDGKYADNPAVANVLMQRINQGSTMAINARGQVSILFRLPTANLQSIFTNSENYLKEPLGSLDCFMVPFDWVIDGVENPEMNDAVYKRLPSSIDVGFIQFCGSSEGVSIKRKIKEVINGRTVYQDTNNSTNDFLTNLEPTPGVIESN